MTETTTASPDFAAFSAFSLSPVPNATPDAAPPELFNGVYAMPMFVTVPTDDLTTSREFWTRGLGFFDFFTAPGQITHLRRWAFQDVLLVPTEENEHAAQNSPMTVSFSCVLSQIEEIATACAKLEPGSVTGPRRTPWNTVDVEIRTPENARVIMTAARPFDPNSAEVENMRAMGIDPPPA